MLANSTFETVTTLVNSTGRIAYEMTLLSTEVRTLRAANEVLSKRCRDKKDSCLSRGGTYSRGCTGYISLEGYR
jgi:hypothetical protein